MPCTCNRGVCSNCGCEIPCDCDIAKFGMVVPLVKMKFDDVDGMRCAFQTVGADQTDSSVWFVAAGELLRRASISLRGTNYNQSYLDFPTRTAGYCDSRVSQIRSP